MAGYARGKKALGECTRCGFAYRLAILREDGETHMLVCPTCYDEKHPSEYPVRTADATGLRRPAPDLDATASRVIDDDRPLGEVLGFDNYFGEQPA